MTGEKTGVRSAVERQEGVYEGHGVGAFRWKVDVPADSRAELVQAPCVGGGGVVEF